MAHCSAIGTFYKMVILVVNFSCYKVIDAFNYLGAHQRSFVRFLARYTPACFHVLFRSRTDVRLPVFLMFLNSSPSFFVCREYLSAVAHAARQNVYPYCGHLPTIFGFDLISSICRKRTSCFSLYDGCLQRDKVLVVEHGVQHSCHVSG